MEKNIKKECIYVFNWVTLLYSRNKHNTVNQLYFNKKIKSKTIKYKDEQNKTKKENKFVTTCGDGWMVTWIIVVIICNVYKHPFIMLYNWN